MGMAVGNVDALRALARIKSNVDSGIFRPLQEAAVQALSVGPEWLASRNDVYQERFGIIAEALRAMGLEVSPPRATLYLWVQAPSDWESEAFARALLKETGVAVASGTFFGPAGEGYVRVSITAPTSRVQEAAARLRSFAFHR